MTDNRPHVQAWWQRVIARKSFQQAVHEPLSAEEKDKMKSSGATIKASMRALRRKYSDSFFDGKPDA